jgi:hypothetical protein
MFDPSLDFKSIRIETFFIFERRLSLLIKLIANSDTYNFNIVTLIKTLLLCF